VCDTIAEYSLQSLRDSPSWWSPVFFLLWNLTCLIRILIRVRGIVCDERTQNLVPPASRVALARRLPARIRVGAAV
jgi:hypothetical protein